MAVDLTKCSVDVNIVLDRGESTFLENVDVTKLDGKTEVEPLVDADLAQFDEFYQRVLNNTKLTNHERAAIKTYLHWKLFPPQK